jgi:hypothetical protein
MIDYDLKACFVGEIRETPFQEERGKEFKIFYLKVFKKPRLARFGG